MGRPNPREQRVEVGAAAQPGQRRLDGEEDHAAELVIDERCQVRHGLVVRPRRAMTTA